MEIPTYKLILVGDGGVGKSVWVSRLEGNRFDGKYVATLGVEVKPLVFATNHGPICINFWDCAGQEKFGGLRDGYFIGTQGAIVMCDATSKLTWGNAKKWGVRVAKVAENIPFVFVANKCDVNAADLSGVQFRVSSKTNTLEELRAPLLPLLHKLTGHQDLVFL
jgi:GTP-binding nuclear protein Ran